MNSMPIHQSARGHVWHQRLAPKKHSFRYPSAMLLIDLDQLHTFHQSCLKINQRGILSFQTRRHLIADDAPSGDLARNFVRERLILDVSGPVKLLTNPHTLGIGFNPFSVYFLHDCKGLPSALIYEVSNTPWNEMHRYVISAQDVADNGSYSFAKEFHVSPFNPMSQEYQTRVTWPYEDGLSVYLALWDHEAQQLIFEAGLSLKLIPYKGQSRKPLFLGIWPQTLVVIAGIYREAFALWRKGLTYHAHP